MWYAKMYFSEGREIFQYDSLGMQGVPDVQREIWSVPVYSPIASNVIPARADAVDA